MSSIFLRIVEDKRFVLGLKGRNVRVPGGTGSTFRWKIFTFSSTIGNNRSAFRTLGAAFVAFFTCFQSKTDVLYFLGGLFRGEIGRKSGQ